MLNTTELIGFGAGGEDVPPITYTNTFPITYPSVSSTFSGINLIPGTKTLVFGIMQHDNGGRYRHTTNVTVNGVAAVRLVTATNSKEYNAEMSFWEITTDADVATIIVYNNGGGSHGGGVARMWTFARPLGTPTATTVLIYTTRTGTITKYQGGVVLALANGFSAGTTIGGIENLSDYVWVNRSAHEVPTVTTINAPISYGSVTTYYNQMMLAVSWMPS